MSPRKDIAGLRFGRLLVISFSHVDKHGNAHWRCRCSCANKTKCIVQGHDLRKGHTQSCGCLWHEKIKAGLNYKHGHAHPGKQSPDYMNWQSMMQRCYNPNNPNFKDYGARGIKVFNSWHDFQAHLAGVLAAIGPRPEGMHGKRPAYTIDRINNDGNYEPGNIRWATWQEQANNRRPAHPRKPGQWLINLPIKTIIRRYRDGVHLTTLATKFGVTRDSIKQRLKHAGVFKPRKKIDLPVSTIIERYQTGEYLKTLATEFGVSRGSIRLRLERAGVFKPGKGPRHDT